MTAWFDFFAKALHREPDERYGNAYDMQTAWRQVFKEAEQRKITTATGEEIVLGVSLDQATLGTPVSALGLSTRARNALERANVITVRDLLKFPIGEIHLMKGVGNQTRQEIIRFVGELREKFPNVEAIKSERPNGFRRAHGTAEPGSPAPSHRWLSQSKNAMPSGRSGPGSWA